MTLYTAIEMEPVPIQCNTAMNSFTISPILPLGMSIKPDSGLIYGTLTEASDISIIYTVTAKNSAGTVTTTFSFGARSNVEMTTPGMTACYWSEVTECLTPDFSFFYSKPAQICQIVESLQFTDNYDYTSWPGLDSRFVDYFAAYFYGYLNILVAGTYTIKMNADDGAKLFIDDIVNPVIDVFGCWATSETTKTITLTQKRHLIIIRYFEYNDGATLYVKLGSPELGIPVDIITSSLLKVGGRGPTFISYKFVAGYSGTPIVSSKPELNSGAPHTWSISAVPAGLSINTQTGIITGIPSAPSSGVYTVTATGVNGVASTTVRIVITSKPNIGFLSKYYKIMDANHCVYPALKGNVVSLKSIQVDSDVNHPENSASFLWPLVPTEFTTYFYVEWEGFLKIESIGNWKLRLSCSSGCKLFGADDQLLISHWGCHAYSSSEATYPVGKNGYYYFRIEYAQNTGRKGIVFEWQAPNGIMEIVPAANIFHSPTGVLSYKYELAHYFKNMIIDDNTPISFSSAGFTNFHMFPSVPAGLEINSQTGIISGTPTEEFITAYFTISATSGGIVEKTVIGMDVQYVIPPADLFIKHNGVTVNSGGLIALTALIVMSPITVEKPANVKINIFTIKPELPEGLSFAADSGKITGKPLVESPVTVYTIVAANSGGSTFLVIRLSVSGCKGLINGVPWTNNFYILTLSSGNAIASVHRGSNVIECGVNEMGMDGNAIMKNCQISINVGEQVVFCVPPNDNNMLRLSCDYSFGCVYQLKRQDGNRFPVQFAYSATSSKPFVVDSPFPAQLIPLSSLILSSNMVNAVSGYSIDTVTITPNGCYKSISIVPSLGSQAPISLLYPRIMGTVYGSGTVDYIITASGDAGSASATLELKFIDCSAEDGKETVTFLKTTQQYGMEESYAVYGNDGALLYQLNGFANYASYTNVLCLSSGAYSIKMMDASGNGWPSGSNVKISGSDGSIIAEMSLSSGAESTQSFHVSVVAVAKEKWKGIVTGKPAKGWNKLGFDWSSWNDITSGDVGYWSDNTIYFVKSFSIDNYMNYPIVEYGIYYKDGLLVYLNGQLVYSRNMASTSIGHTSVAISSYDDYYLRIGTAPGYLLVDGDNILAVEMHKHPSTGSSTIKWKGYVKFNKGSCISRIDGGYVTESTYNNKDSETANQAWDRNLNTQWVENGIPAWTVYSYSFDRMEWVNKFVIGSAASNPESDPTQINVMGTTDSVHWDLILHIEKKAIWTKRKQLQEFMMMDHMSSYGKYKVEIVESANNVAKTGISYLDLMACQLIYCPGNDGYPGAMAGKSVVIECPTGFIGERTRQCQQANFQPSWSPPDETECRSKYPTNKKISYIDFAYVISSVTVEALTTSSLSVHTVLANTINIVTKNIDIWKIKDVTTLFVDSIMGDAVKSAVYIRVECSNDESSAVLAAVTLSPAKVQADLVEYYNDVFGESRIGFYIKPELHQAKNLSAISVGIIILLVIVLSAVVALVSFYLWVRTKNRKTKSGSKQLRSGIKHGKEKKTISKEAKV